MTSEDCISDRLPPQIADLEVLNEVSQGSTAAPAGRAGPGGQGGAAAAAAAPMRAGECAAKAALAMRRFIIAESQSATREGIESQPRGKGLRPT